MRLCPHLDRVKRIGHVLPRAQNGVEIYNADCGMWCISLTDLLGRSDGSLARNSREKNSKNKYSLLGGQKHGNKWWRANCEHEDEANWRWRTMLPETTANRHEKTRKKKIGTVQDRNNARKRRRFAWAAWAVNKVNIRALERRFVKTTRSSPRIRPSDLWFPSTWFLKIEEPVARSWLIHWWNAA